MDEWLRSMGAGLVSAAAVLAAVAFLARTSLTSWIDQRLERLKHELGLEATRRELLIRSQIEFKERQLAEFYGPIYALLKRGRPIYDLWKAGRLHEIEGATRELFITANNRIVEIILTRSHLIRGPEIPESFTRFLTHVAVWHAYAETPHKGVPFSREQFPEAFSPDGFEKEIVSTTEGLKRELDELYHRYGLEAQPLAGHAAV